MTKETIDTIIATINKSFVPNVVNHQVAKDKYGEVLRIFMDNGYCYSARIEGSQVDVGIHNGKTHRSKFVWRALFPKIAE
jgi:hypothetical protein